MKKKLMVLSGFVLGLAPVVAFAAPAICTYGGPGGDIPTLGSLMCKVSGLLGAVLPILIALAVIYFVWGIISFVISDDEEAKTKGRDRIIYGVIGLAVIVGVWGLVNILTATFGIPQSGVNTPGIPDLNSDVNLPTCVGGQTPDKYNCKT